MAQSAGVDDAEPMRQYLRRLDVAAPAPPVSLGVRSVLSTVGIVAQGAQRFFYTLVIGRVAGPALVGQVNSLFSLALFASLLWPTATGAAATKYVAAARGRGDVAGTRAVAAFLARRTVVSALICAVPAVVVARLALGADVASMVALAGLVLAYSGYAFVRGLQFGTGRIPRATVWDLVISVGTLVGAVLVLVSTSPALLLAPLNVGYAAFAIQGWPRATRTPSLRPHVGADAFVVAGLLMSVAVAATNSLVSRSLTGQRVSVLSSTVGAVVGVLAWVALVPPRGVVGGDRLPRRFGRHRLRSLGWASPGPGTAYVGRGRPASGRRRRGDRGGRLRAAHRGGGPRGSMLRSWPVSSCSGWCPPAGGRWPQSG